MYCIAYKPHAKLHMNSYIKISPSVIYHLIVRLLEINSCSDEGRASMQLSASLQSKQSTVLSAPVTQGGRLRWMDKAFPPPEIDGSGSTSTQSHLGRAGGAQFVRHRL